jgi:CRISPR system Cascade subunit CasA
VLHRHLLAILHRVYDGPKNMREWGAIARAPTLDAARIDAYLERVRDRMDLLHPTQPFGQVRGLARTELKVHDAVDLDLRRWGWGNATPLFSHNEVAHTSRSHALATRLLLVLHAYAFFGVVPGLNPTAKERFGEPHAGGAAPLLNTGITLLRGGTLKATLVANLVRHDPSLEIPSGTTGADAPAWERPPLPVRLTHALEPRRVPDGLLDQLTWQSRRIELLGDESGVNGYVILRGQSYPEGAEPLDSMAFYARNVDAKAGERAWRAYRVSADKAFWRDANVLFARLDDTTKRRPLAVDQICRPEAVDVLGPNAAFDVAFIGFDPGGQKLNVATVRLESLHAAAKRLDDVDARGLIESVLAFVEAAKRAFDDAVGAFAKSLLPSVGGGPEPKAVKALSRALAPDARFWSEVGRDYAVFSRELDGSLTAAEWSLRRKVIAITQSCFASALDAAPETGRAARARTLAQGLLDHSLRQLQSDQQPIQDEEASHA